MKGLLQDLRYALRTLTGSPTFAAAAIVTLALGIGANTAIYGWIRELILSPLPGISRANEIVAVEGFDFPSALDRTQALPFYRRLMERETSVPGVVAASYVALRGGQGQR